MGKEISKLCRCLPKSSIAEDDDKYIVPEIKLLAEYYSPNITDKEKEDILKAELKRLKLNRKSQRVNVSRSSNSNSNNYIANNHPYPLFLANEEKINMDANKSVNTESLESNFGQIFGNIQLSQQKIVSEDNTTYANIHSHQNEGQKDTPLVFAACSGNMQSFPRSKSSPVLSMSRASVSPVMDDAIWKLLDANPGAMFTPSVSERFGTFGMPPKQPMIIPGLSSESMFGMSTLLPIVSDKNEIISSMTISSSVRSGYGVYIEDNNTANEVDIDDKKAEVKSVVEENVGSIPSV